MTTYEENVTAAGQLARVAMRAAGGKVSDQPEGVFTMEAADALATAFAGLTFAVLAVADRVDAAVTVLEER